MKKLIGALLAIAMLSVPSAWITYGTMTTVTFEVTSKERVSGDNSSKYLVFTPNEVFENTDTWWTLKFNSSDLYGKLVVGSTCEAKVSGFRVPFLSWYRNIHSVNCK